MFKILYLVSTLRRCGPTQQLLNLVKHIDRQLCHPQILTLSTESQDTLIDKFTGVGIPVASLGLRRFAGFLPHRSFSDYVSEFKPDIIHSNGFRADIFSARINSGAHTVTTVRNYPFENYAYDFGWFGRYIMAPFHLRMLRRIEKTVTVSRTLSERFLKEHGFACDIVPNAVDQDIFSPVSTAQKRQIRSQLGLPIENRLFVVSGYLSVLKDPVCVAEGFLKAAVPNTTMIFLGDGAMREKLEPLLKTGKLILAGRVKNVHTYLHACDFLVSGSRTEGMPNAVIEAMACGLPCILSDIGAHEEIERYSPASTKLFRVNDAQNLADKIREMLDQDYEKISLAAVQAVTHNLSAQTMSRNYQRVYASILNQKETMGDSGAQSN